MDLLRGVLSRRPKPASQLEEMAEENSIGSKQIKAARELLGLTVKRPDNVQASAIWCPAGQPTPIQRGTKSRVPFLTGIT